MRPLIREKVKFTISSWNGNILSEMKKNYNVIFIFLVGWLFGFNGISTFVGYLTPNPFLYK